MVKKETFLFLCTRLADYMFQCIRHLTEEYDCNAIVVRYRPDKLTRYDFADTERIRLIFKDETRIDKSFLDSCSPAAVFSSSWRDKDYKQAGRLCKNKIPVIIGIDNPWRGNWKQYAHCLLSAFTIKPYFSHAWVPGYDQYVYATMLGFKNANLILSGYSANTTRLYSENGGLNVVSRTKTVVYIGRLVEYKKAHWLANCFNSIQQENPSLADWRLHFYGQGPLMDTIASLNNQNIVVKGFLPPHEIPAAVQNCSIFCLPASNEHWGVVVHEAAALGLPLLLSDSVSSGRTYLINGYNGSTFKTDDQQDLKTKLLKMMSLSADTINSYGVRSRELSRAFSKDTWAAHFLSVLER